jgi:hypothetical protein
VNNGTTVNDTGAQNEDFETLGAAWLNFSENNPFGTP